MFSPNKAYRVYDQNIWWSDVWDPIDYGHEFDFSRSFFEQFSELLKEVPRPSLNTMKNENCSFVNQCGYSKNCYLSYNTDFSEKCIYTNNAFKCNNCIDVLNAESCENCYESTEIKNCYHCFFSQRCKDSSHIFYCYNLNNCKNCFACVNLINKEYHILNKAYSREEYLEEIKKYKNHSEDLFKELKQRNPHLYANIENSENAL